MRGEVTTIFFASWATRITPACAGRSFVSADETRTTWDHPRVCGEKAKLPDCASSMRGSPPRVRGEVDGSAAVPVSWGITPACAGRRLTMQYPDTGVQDHPRVCGEKFVFIDHSSFPLGSPPRVRGEAGPDQGAQGVARITPACAGRSGSPDDGTAQM